jgi:hypothetical protein
MFKTLYKKLYNLRINETEVKAKTTQNHNIRLQYFLNRFEKEM